MGRRYGQQGVSIGCRLAQGQGGHIAASAQAVFHRDGLLPLLRPFLRQQARCNVGHATGREAHQNFHWLLRISGLSCGGTQAPRQCPQEQGPMASQAQ